MALITQYFDQLTAEVMRLNHMAQDINDSLQAQTNYLRMRDRSLPPDILVRVSHMNDTLRELVERIEEQQTELAQLRALATTTQLINSSLDLNTVLSRAMDTVIGLTDAERGIIFLRDEETGEMRLVVARGIERTILTEDQFNVSQTVIDLVFQQGEPIVTTNAQEDERFRTQESVMSYDLRSILCVPLVYQGEISGVVYADNRVRNALFGERELQLLMAFGNQAAIAIENARLFEQVRASLAEVTEIQQFLDNIFTSIASGVITTDQAGYVRTCNPVAEQILGVSAQESIGRPVLEVLPALYEGFENVLSSVENEGKQEIVETNVVLPHIGRSMSLNIKISPLKDEENNTVGLALVLDDLTDIKQRDETLNVVQTYLPPAMVTNIASIDNLGLGGEERDISIVFGDVRGFTSFSERLEPEATMQIINKYLSTSSVAIQLLEGIIDKYMGDAVVGLYNTQLNPQEDHAMRAVRAAVAIIHDVNGLHEELPPNQRLLYGIGVHTGTAMLGNVGSPSRKEFTALGHTVTYCKKLQEIAQGGEVIISAETYELVKDVFEAEPIQRQFRGSNEVVTVYKIIDLMGDEDE
jgi:PAS domain S-box-containing protein